VISIIIPSYNEIKYLPKLLDKVLAVKWPQNLQAELIVVDDGSNDGTHNWLRENTSRLGFRYIYHSQNKGKGAAIRSGIAESKGNIIVVQDADLEYDPNELVEVINPIISGITKVCYGSRYLKRDQIENGRSWVKKHRGYFFAYVGGRAVTHFCNLLYGSKLTDEPTCYKAFAADLLRVIPLSSSGFELEPEITAKVLKRTTILEVPIHYYPRTYEEGKKIKWKDGVLALWKLLKHKFID
jgi:glycosyltransferase involved in cell wall biosynthesis